MVEFLLTFLRTFHAVSIYFLPQNFQPPMGYARCVCRNLFSAPVLQKIKQRKLILNPAFLLRLVDDIARQAVPY